MKKLFAAALLIASFGAQAEIHYNEFGWYDDCLGETYVEDFHADMLYADNVGFHNGRNISDDEIAQINADMMWSDDVEFDNINVRR